MKVKLEELKKQRSELQKQLTNVEKKIIAIEKVPEPKKGRIGFNGKVITKSDIPFEYSTNMTMRKKVLFTLNKLKRGTVKEITESIVKLEKDKSYEKVYPQIQQTVLKLLNNNNLNKLGDYNSKYELKIDN
ncbi:MAG: hypothetical protein V4565_12085 [Bacteroidota bacterium]